MKAVTGTDTGREAAAERHRWVFKPARRQVVSGLASKRSSAVQLRFNTPLRGPTPAGPTPAAPSPVGPAAVPRTAAPGGKAGGKVGGKTPVGMDTFGLDEFLDGDYDD